MHCTECGEQNPDTARFCAACGKPLLQPKNLGTLQRILTLVFIDLVGSTVAADTQELEDYDELLQRFHRRCADVIAQYDGAVLQLYGDGVLACFGLSEDSENAALAAVAASLAVVDAIPQATDGMQVRAGVHSGKVICRVEESGALLPQVSGLDVNVCSRVQGQAEPSGVVITGATMSFVERIADVDAVDLGLRDLKGVSNPLPLFEVRSYSFEDTVSAAETLFERDDVLAQVAGADGGYGQARVTVVIGSPGIGKSALLAELSRRLAGDFTFISLSARNNLRHTPLYPLAEWLARALGYQHFPLGAEDREDELPARCEALLGALPADRQLVLADVLGIGDSAELYARYAAPQIREMRISAVAQCLIELMARGPVLLTFDDFHWVDDDSRAVLDRLLDHGIAPTSRVVIASRPDPKLSEYLEWRRLPEVQLEPLSASGAEQLLEQAGLESLAAEDKAQIIALAEGNPLFLKTLLKFMRRGEITGASAALPPTIDATFQGVINSFREAKELVLLASVIGRTFSIRELRYLAEDHVSFADRFGELVRGGLLVAEQNYWQFSHILLQEAAYNMLPGSRRRALHNKFADALVANEPQRVEEFPEIVADHYVAAESPEAIAGSCLQAGIHFLRQASHERAQYYLEQAVAAMRASGEETSLLSALTALSAAKLQRYGFMHPETLAGYRDLEQAVRGDTEHSHERILALNNVFAQRIMSGHVREARSSVDELAAMTNFDDAWENIMYQQADCAYRLYSGHFSQALGAATDLREAYDAEAHGTIFLHTGSDPLIGVLTAEANVYALRAQLEDAIRVFGEAETHVEKIGAELQKPWVLIFTGSALAYTPGAETLSLDRLERGCTIADTQGSGFWSLNGRLWRSVVASERGEPGTGELDLMALIEQQSAVGIGLNRPFFLSVHAWDLHRAGDSEQALTLAREATRLATAMGQGQWRPEIWRKRAEIHWDLGQTRQARRSWAIAMAYAQRSQAAVWEQRCRADLDARGLS